MLSEWVKCRKEGDLNPPGELVRRILEAFGCFAAITGASMLFALSRIMCISGNQVIGMD